MPSEFDQYFQEFLSNAPIESGIFNDDFSSEPEALHHSDDWQLHGKRSEQLRSYYLRGPGKSLSRIQYDDRFCSIEGDIAVGDRLLHRVSPFFFRSTLTGRAVGQIVNGFLTLVDPRWEQRLK